MTTTRWWWVRHAPVTNPEGQIYGQTDPAADLSDAARLRALAGRLPDTAVWVTTTLRRARDTAGWLAGRIPGTPTVRQDDRFREQSFGDWEGARWNAVPAEESTAYWRDPVAGRGPGGESFADVIERVVNAIRQLNHDCAGGDIVVVAHAGPIRAALVHALGCPPAAGLAFQIAPLSLTRLDAIKRDGTVWWRVGGVNLSADPP
jgi:alpha-ribazole phosphatase